MITNLIRHTPPALGQSSHRLQALSVATVEVDLGCMRALASLFRLTNRASERIRRRWPQRHTWPGFTELSRSTPVQPADLPGLVRQARPGSGGRRAGASAAARAVDAGGALA